MINGTTLFPHIRVESHSTCLQVIICMGTSSIPSLHFYVFLDNTAHAKYSYDRILHEDVFAKF